MDVHALAYNTETPYDPARHVILGWYPWLDYLKRISNNDRLFVVHFRDTKLFAVCVWVFSPQESTVPVFSELEGFHGSPGAPWPEGLIRPEVCRRRFRPYEEQAREADLRDRARADARVQGELAKREMQATYARHLRKRGMFNTARLMERGQLPINMNEDARRQWRDEFETARRTSVVKE